MKNLWEKIKRYAIGFGIGVLVASIGFGVYLFFQKPKIKIVKKTETIFKYIKTPSNMEGFKECYDSKLKIDGTIKDNILHVESYDKCKKAERDFYLKSKAKFYHHTVSALWWYDIPEKLSNYGLMYHYNVAFFGIGAGAWFGNTEHFGVMAGAKFSF